MAATIRPRRIDWPSAFWKRAEGSWLENDLVCRNCMGSGCQVSREDAWEGITSEEVACSTCRSSGLLAPVHHLPDDPEEVWTGEGAGGCWLDWIGHEDAGLLWPLPWCWTISRKLFSIRRDVYIGGQEVLAYMLNGSVVIGLFKMDEGSRGRLEMVFKQACGEAVEVPGFVGPRQGH